MTTKLNVDLANVKRVGPNGTGNGVLELSYGTQTFPTFDDALARAKELGYSVAYRRSLTDYDAAFLIREGVVEDGE